LPAPRPAHLRMDTVEETHVTADNDYE